MAMNGGIPDLAAMNTSFIGKLSQKILASNEAFVDIWATGVVMMSNLKNGPSPEEDRFWAALTYKHNTARNEFAELLQQIVMAGGDPTGLGLDYDIDEGLVDTEYKIEGAASDGSGSYSRADIYYSAGNYMWFWEVKGSVKHPMSPEDFDAKSKLAAEEVAIDVREFNKNEAVKAQQEPEYIARWAMPGFRANSAKVFYWTDIDYGTWKKNVNAYIVGDGNPQDAGAVVYHRVSPDDDLETPLSRFYTEPPAPAAVTQPPASAPELAFDLTDPNAYLVGPEVDISGLTEPIKDAVLGGGQILVNDVKDYWTQLEDAVDAVGTGLNIVSDASAMSIEAVGGVLSGNMPTADLVRRATQIAVNLSKLGG